MVFHIPSSLRGDTGKLTVKAKSPLGEDSGDINVIVLGAFVRLDVFLCVWMCACLSRCVCLYVRVCACMSGCLFVCLGVFLYVWMYGYV